MKTLIAYATRWGATAKTAELLARTLKETDGRDAEARDARKIGSADLDAFDSFVVGSSIAAGRWKGSARSLLRKLAIRGKPTAVFVSAGGVLSGGERGAAPDSPPKSTLEQRQAEAVARYVDPVAGQAGLTPVAKSAFGGRMAFFGKEVFDSWDPEPIRAWAASIAPKLC